MSVQSEISKWSSVAKHPKITSASLGKVKRRKNGLAKEEQGQRYLTERGVELQVLPTPQMIDAFNEREEQKAALLHLTC